MSISLKSTKPKVEDFYTDCAMHNAMNEYANTFSRGNVRVIVEYNDGSKDDNYHTFSFTQKQVSYKTRDGEVWEVSIDTAKINGDFLFDFKPLTPKMLKSALLDFIDRGEGIVKSITLIVEK